MQGDSDASLVWVISRAIGPWGAIIAGLTGIFICTATIIAYVGAASRVAYALSRQGQAFRWMGRLSQRFHTPIGGIAFLSVCFVIIMVLYGSGAVSLTKLIQFPNATFILTYLGGCAAGIKLLRGSRWGVAISWISFISTAIVFPFVGWAMLYPCLIAAVLWTTDRIRHKRTLSQSASTITEQEKATVRHG